MTRLSVVWPLLILAAAVLWIMQAVGALPAAFTDLIGRAWPVLLVALGLMMLLGRRVRYGNLLAIIVCALLTGGVVTAAYNQQAGKIRADNRKPFNQAIDPGVTNVKIAITTLGTEIAVLPAESDKPVITGEFVGSKESLVISDYQVDGSTGTFTLVENQGSAIASLESVGKGKLTLRLPAGVTIDQLTINGREGDVQLDAAVANVKNMAISLNAGNLSVKLPNRSGLIADLKTGRGNAVIEVPKAIAANITLRGGGATNPGYNAADYILDVNRVLVSKRAAEPQMQITVEVSDRITVQ